jgi:hypothetical protein
VYWRGLIFFVCDAFWFLVFGFWFLVFGFWFLVFGLRPVSLASALCIWSASVAPVRGGTYFSLPPQRKVGKRKRLTPPTFLPA